MLLKSKGGRHLFFRRKTILVEVECVGSVGRVLDWDRRVASLRLTGVLHP